jgi:hypothetical protein
VNINGGFWRYRLLRNESLPASFRKLVIAIRSSNL